MDVVGAAVAESLQGPRSLSSQEADSASDFIVINGVSSSPSGYDEADLFSSLSQPDTAAHARELMMQNDVLQKNFTDCTKRLSDVTNKYSQLKTQEAVKCEQARKRIGDLTEEVKLFKTENARLTHELSACKANGGTSAMALSPDEIPSSSQVHLGTEEGALLRTVTPETCTSTTAAQQSITVQHESPLTHSNETVLHAEIDELKEKNEELESLNDELKRQIREIEERAKTEVQKHEARNAVMERQCTQMSTTLTHFRRDKDMEIAKGNAIAVQLQGRCAELEQRLEEQVQESQTTQAEILSGLRKKCKEFEDNCSEQRRKNEKEHREWQEKYRALQQQCRDIEASKVQLSKELHKQMQDIDLQRRDLKESVTKLQTEKTHHEERIAQLRLEKRETDGRLHKLSEEKRKDQGVIKYLGSTVEQCTNKFQAMGGLEAEIAGLKSKNKELQRRVTEQEGAIEGLKRQNNDLGESVGVEVPTLITQCDELKQKLKAEKKDSQSQIDRLQETLNEVQTNLGREKRQVEKQTTIIRDLRQSNATFEGDIRRLRREIGELNSHNINMGRATLPANHQRLGTTPEEVESTPQHHAGAAAQSNIEKCPFGCGVTGDEEFLNNHVNRDHPDV